MTGFEQSASLWGAFIAGLVTGVHCAGMCGLLTCGLGISNRPDYSAALTGYHSGRTVSTPFSERWPEPWGISR